MYGAIIGDFIGSIYEFQEFNESLKKQINHSRRKASSEELILLKSNCFYSDDTILTIAVLDSILSKKSYEESIKKYILDTSIICKTNEETFSNPFSPRLLKWAKGEKPNDSIGNGSAMRVSPIAYLYDDLDTILSETEKWAKITLSAVLMIL